VSTTNPGLSPPSGGEQRQQGQITIAAANKLNLKSATSMNLQTDFDGLNINVSGVELTDNDLDIKTLTGSIFNLTVAGAANWANTGKVTETFLASQKTNITGDLDLDTTTTIDIKATGVGDITIESDAGNIELNP
jgi:phage-related protein